MTRLLLAAVAGIAVLAASAAASKAEDLHYLSQQSAAQLTDRNYEKLVLGRGREYDLFVLYTAREAQYGCGICGAMEDEFLTTAASFWRMPENADRRDVFFAVVNFPRASAVFQKHGFKSVPMLVHFPPSSEDARAGKQRWHIRPSQLYEVTDSALSAEGIARFVKRHSAAGDISIYRSPWPKIAGAALTLAALAGAVRLALANLPLVLAAVRSKRLWVVVCIGIYFLSISGFVFDIIRNPPPFVCQQGRCMFIHPQSGTQFVAEGFIIGGLTLACAAAAVRLVHTYAAGHKAAERQVTTTLLALVAFAVLYSQVLAIYRGKNPWYPFRLLF